MSYNPEKHHRHSIRLQNYDYSQQGAYFITLCTYQRESLFGEIKDNQLYLNEAGLLVQKEWDRTGKIRPNIIVDEFIVMPNHLHGVLIIESPKAPDTDLAAKFSNSKAKIKASSIGAIMTGFKSTVTRQFNQLRQSPDTPVWQRNYYEHIIRDEPELERIREYIITNPARWSRDKYNPANSRG